MLDTCLCMWFINLKINANKCTINALFHPSCCHVYTQKKSGRCDRIKCVCKDGQVVKHTFMLAGVCEGISHDVVVQCFWTVDAVERSSTFCPICLLTGDRWLGGGAVVEVLHHDHQFALRFVHRFILVVLEGQSRAAKLLWLNITGHFVCCGDDWWGALILKDEYRKQNTTIRPSLLWLPEKWGSDLTHIRCSMFQCRSRLAHFANSLSSSDSS